MKSYLNFKNLILFSTLFVYSFLAYLFLYKTHESYEYPYLRARLGTVLFHPDHQSKGAYIDFHTYCYYPKSTIMEGQTGEVIIKKVNTLTDCQNWYGVMSIPESRWVSEIEKFWWSEQQKNQGV